MAATLAGLLAPHICEGLTKGRVLLVGVGGIGCELLKQLVLLGCMDIDLVDEDKIEASNLNRQCLYSVNDVGRPKVQVAKEKVQQMNRDARITEYNSNITTSAHFHIDFYMQYSVVVCAVDNRETRYHINRMCLAADVPLIDTGASGYIGQTTVIRKGITECYECLPRPFKTSYPRATIRNAPEHINHCVTWAKHLFNQLFGVYQPEEEVTPDLEDRSAIDIFASLASYYHRGESSSQAPQHQGGTHGGHTTLRQYAAAYGYNPHQIFRKLYNDDIQQLVCMSQLWLERDPPRAIDLQDLPQTVPQNEEVSEHSVLTLSQYVEMFVCSVATLSTQLNEDRPLVWNKHNETMQQFVTSAANIRAFVFGIDMMSMFDIRGIAGSILPGVVTTSGILAGVVAMEVVKILTGNIQQCKTVYLNKKANANKKLLIPCYLDAPNPRCYVCSEKPEIILQINTETLTVKALQEKILKSHLGMGAPDVEIDDGRGSILISSEEGETEDNMYKPLSQFGIKSGSILKCDDFQQVYSLNVNIIHTQFDDGSEVFKVTDISRLHQNVDDTHIVDLQEKRYTTQDNSDSDSDDCVIIDDPDEVDDVINTSLVATNNAANVLSASASPAAAAAVAAVAGSSLAGSPSSHISRSTSRNTSTLSMSRGPIKRRPVLCVPSASIFHSGSKRRADNIGDDDDKSGDDGDNAMSDVKRYRYGDDYCDGGGDGDYDDDDDDVFL